MNFQTILELLENNDRCETVYSIEYVIAPINPEMVGNFAIVIWLDGETHKYNSAQYTDHLGLHFPEEFATLEEAKLAHIQTR